MKQYIVSYSSLYVYKAADHSICQIALKQGEAWHRITKPRKMCNSSCVKARGVQMCHKSDKSGQICLRSGWMTMVLWNYWVTECFCWCLWWGGRRRTRDVDNCSSIYFVYSCFPVFVYCIFVFYIFYFIYFMMMRSEKENKGCRQLCLHIFYWQLLGTKGHLRCLHYSAWIGLQYTHSAINWFLCNLVH